MALRLDNTLDNLTTTANLMPTTTFTAMGWFKVSAHTGNYQHLIMLHYAGDTNAKQVYVPPDALTLTMWTGFGQVAGDDLTLDGWHHVALVGRGETGVGLEFWLDGVIQGASDNVAQTSSRVEIGRAGETWLNGAHAAWKEWDDHAMDEAEIALEMAKYQPVRTANLHRYCPNRTVAEAGVDLSGNGFDLSVGGTLAEVAGPDITDDDAEPAREVVVTWYIHGDTGSDLADGLTPETARATLPDDEDVISGDTFNLAGKIRGTFIYDGKDDLTFQQWEGQATCELRGDRIVTQSPWVDTEGGAHAITIPTPVNGLQSVTVDWDDSVDANGFNYGHLAAVADQATCEATDDSWYFDSAEDTLYVRIGENEDPAGFTVAYVDTAGANLLDLRNCDNCSVTLGGGALCGDPVNNDGEGYVVAFNGCANITCYVGTLRDVGKHGIGTLNCSGTVELGWGVASGMQATDSSMGVFYSATGDVDGAVVTGGTWYPRGMLGRDGSEMNGTTHAQAGWHTHTDGAGGREVVDMEVRDFHTVAVAGFHAGSTTPLHTSWSNTAATAVEDGHTEPAYPVRFVRGSLRGTVRILSDTESAHFREVLFDIPDAGALGGAGATAGACVTIAGAHSGHRAFRFVSCAFRCNLDTANVGHEGKIFKVANDAGDEDGFYFINCTAINVGTQNSGVIGFKSLIALNGNDGAFTYGRRNLFGHLTADASHFNIIYDDGSGATWDWDDNLYLNIPEVLEANGAVGGYSYVSGQSKIATWTSEVDALAQAITGNPFANSAVNLRLSPGSEVFLLRATNTDHEPARGVDGAAYVGLYGAYQGLPASGQSRLNLGLGLGL